LGTWNLVKFGQQFLFYTFLQGKNKFLVNMGQNLNSFLKWNFGLISR
jgi:hypothetical protein